MDKETLLNNINQINGVKGSMLVSKDGLVLENKMPEDVDPNLISAVLSSMFTNIEVQSKRMQRGNVQKFSIETDSDVLTLTQVQTSNETLLVFCNFDKDADLDEINKALNNATKG